MRVMMVVLGTVKHYAHPENARTLCGLVGGSDTRGVPHCRRCIQIFRGVDTSRQEK